MAADYIPMNPRRRALNLSVIDGDFRVMPYLHHFDMYVRCDDMLTWLVKNKLTGKNFYEWARRYYEKSYMGPAQEILRRMNKEAENQVVKFGRDVKIPRPRANH